MDLTGLGGVLGTLATVGGFLAIPVLAVAIWQWRASRRDVAALASIREDELGEGGFSSVMVARANFTKAVRSYEEALARPSVEPAPVGGSQTPSIFAQNQPASAFSDGSNRSLEVLEQGKNRAREELISAQRLWESSKPVVYPSSDLDLWFGSGIMRGWNLGLIGYERSVVRIDHAVDPECWSAWRISRVRLGPAVGVERQSLALYIVGARPDAIGALLGRGFGGVELAARPGIAPGRTWRRIRRDPLTRRSIEQVLKASSLTKMLIPPSAECRDAVVVGFEYELGQPLGSVEELPVAEAILAIHSSGLSLSLGIWGGREPRAKLVSSSAHQAWDN